MLSEALLLSPFVQTTAGQLMKIFCVARSFSTFRLALKGTTYLSARAHQMLQQNCGYDCQHREAKENINLGLIKSRNAKFTSSLNTCVTAENLFDYGKTRLKELIEENTPESLQESELLRIFRSAVGLPMDKRLGEGIHSCKSLHDQNRFSTSLWHVAEERWKETTEKLSSYTPEKMIHSAIEIAQERVKEFMANNSLVSQVLEAGDLLTSAKQSIKNEAEILSQLLCKGREHTLSGVSGFLKRYHENQSPLETLYNLVNEHIISHLACEGMELFLEYIWTMKPDFYEQDILAANMQHIDDEGFYFMAEERRVPRRSILYIGAR